MNNELHVVPSPQGGWNIKQISINTPLFHCDKKEEAIAKVKQLGIRAKSELIIHNTDGRIAAKDSYGNDPRSSQG